MCAMSWKKKRLTNHWFRMLKIKTYVWNFTAAEYYVGTFSSVIPVLMQIREAKFFLLLYCFKSVLGQGLNIWQVWTLMCSLYSIRVVTLDFPSARVLEDVLTSYSLLDINGSHVSISQQNLQDPDLQKGCCMTFVPFLCHSFYILFVFFLWI